MELWPVSSSVTSSKKITSAKILFLNQVTFWVPGRREFGGDTVYPMIPVLSSWCGSSSLKQGSRTELCAVILANRKEKELLSVPI